MGAQEGAFNSVFNNTFIMSNQFVRTLTLRDHEALLVIEKRTFLEFVSEGIVFPRRRTWSEGDCQQFDAIALHNKSLPWLNSENSTESTVSGCGTSDLLSGSDDDTPCEGVNTTVMITRLPSDFTRDKFISMLDMEGFQGCYGFVYMPVDFNALTTYGFAFVNLSSHGLARRLRRHFHGYESSFTEYTTLEAIWSDKDQGLEANIDRYRNSPVMHRSMPDDVKPMLFHMGQTMTFPSPTKTIKAPRIRGAKRQNSWTSM